MAYKLVNLGKNDDLFVLRLYLNSWYHYQILEC